MIIYIIIYICIFSNKREHLYIGDFKQRFNMRMCSWQIIHRFATKSRAASLLSEGRYLEVPLQV